MPYNVKRHAVAQPQDQSIKFIPLTKGKHCIVNSRNYAWLSQWNWFAVTGGTRGSKFYAARTEKRQDGSKYAVFMHREILGMGDKCDDPRDVDHKNGDGLDNRTDNIRPCTRPQNCANSPRRKIASSGYRWVRSESGRRKPWKVVVGGLYIGHYRTKAQARVASLDAAEMIYGGFAHIN